MPRLEGVISSPDSIPPYPTWRNRADTFPSGRQRLRSNGWNTVAG